MTEANRRGGRPGRDTHGEVWDIGQWDGPHFAVVSPLGGFPPFWGGCGWVNLNHHGFQLSDHLRDMGADPRVRNGPGATPLTEAEKADLHRARIEYDAMWADS